MSNNKFKNINYTQKPRERLLLYGGETLNDAELIALILQTGNKKFSVYTLASFLLQKYGNIENLIDQSIQELITNDGIGEAKAIKIKSLYYIYKSIENNKIFKTKNYKINGPDDIYKYANWIGQKEEENFYIVCLKNNNEIICIKHLFKGNLNSVMISPREIFKETLSFNSNKICLIHNHPSGDLTPSVADIKSTEKLIEAASIMGIKVIDHIIISKTNYYSLNEQKVINFN